MYNAITVREKKIHLQFQNKLTNLMTYAFMEVRQLGSAIAKLWRKNCRTIAFAFSMYKAINRTGVNITEFYRKNDTLTITYILGNRQPLKYEELLELQKIIEPEQNIVPGVTDKYPIPVGYHGDYSLFIRIPAWLAE